MWLRSLSVQLLPELLSFILLSHLLSGCTASTNTELEATNDAAVLATVPMPTQLCQQARDDLDAEIQERESQRPGLGQLVQEMCETISTPIFGNVKAMPLSPQGTSVGPAALFVALYAFISFEVSWYVAHGHELDDDLFVQAFAIAVPQYGALAGYINLLSLLLGVDSWELAEAQGRAVQFATQQIGHHVAHLIQDEVVEKTNVAKEWLNDQPPFPWGWCSKICQAGLVTLLTATVSSIFSGAVQQTIESEIEDDSPPRTAYVLGASAYPLEGKAGTFLILMSQYYKKVFVNDRLLLASNDSVVAEYTKRCFPPRTTESSNQNRQFCNEITAVPADVDKIDFRYMGMPAGLIPGPIHDADVYVMFPSPGWFYKNFGDDSNNLGQDLRYLIGNNTRIFLLTDFDLYYEPDDLWFDKEGLMIVPRRVDIVGQIAMDNNGSYPAPFGLFYNDRIQRYITVTSTHLESNGINLFEITR